MWMHVARRERVLRGVSYEESDSAREDGDGE